MRRLLVTVAFLLVLAGLPLAGGASPDAAKPAPKLPPAPIKCQTPDGDGCYGWQYGPEYMDNTFIGEMTIAPHIVKVGQSVQITMDAFATADWTAQAGAPCGEIMRGATTGGAIDAKCTQKMTSPTHGWLRLPGTFCYLPPIACGTEQEALYVLGEDEYAISGIVRDAGGKGVKNVRIDISPGYYAVTENINGFYQALLKKGKYTVTAPAGYCVKGVRPCTRSKVVNLTGATAVDFQEQGYELSGTVTKKECTPRACKRAPMAGVTLVARGGGNAHKTVTDAKGAYSLDLAPGPYSVTPRQDNLRFSPSSRQVRLARDRSGVDFVHCAAPPEGIGRVTGETSCERTISGEWTEQVCGDNSTRIAPSLASGLALRLRVGGKNVPVPKDFEIDSQGRFSFHAPAGQPITATPDVLRFRRVSFPAWNPESRRIAPGDGDLRGQHFRRCFAAAAPTRLTVDTVFAAGRRTFYDPAGVTIQSNGTLRICNKGPVIIRPYSNSPHNNYDGPRLLPEKCTTVVLRNPTKKLLYFELYDNLHAQAYAAIVVLPRG